MSDINYLSRVNVVSTTPEIIRANVGGSKVNDFGIQINRNETVKMRRDCPHADSGDNCK